jgi:hypothetical protein
MAQVTEEREEIRSADELAETRTHTKPSADSVLQRNPPNRDIVVVIVVIVVTVVTVVRVVTVVTVVTVVIVVQ